MLSQDSRKVVRDGTASSADDLTQRLIPFEVPVGTTSISIAYTYTGRAEGNAIDLGLLGVRKQFRGYSGGSKTQVTVANDHATPGYIAGLLPPGEWYVLLGIYTIVPAASPSSYRVEINLDDRPLPVFQSAPAPVRADFSGSTVRRPGQRHLPRWLKGDFHMHTVYSDGQFTPDQLVEKANKRGLDFIFSTEHNTFSSNLIWGDHVPRGFLVGRGIEVTTIGGHWNALGLLPDQYIDPSVDGTNMDASLIAAVEAVHKSDGFAIINHPFAECKCCGWTYSFHEHMDGIEVWNGPWKRHPEDQSNIKAVAKWDELLRAGTVFVATGGSDIHEPRFEIAEPCTRVLAEEVSVYSIIQGLRRGTAYITQHPHYEIEFELRSDSERAAIGGWLAAAGEVAARVRLTGFPSCELRVITEAGTIHRTSETQVELLVRARYVRLEVRSEQDDMLGLTNPIWVVRS
ncbi:hypothetical protein JCM24511_10014 [Saitozyma sp. JCM 24511]|nr:hypothetical protein JCM24511_10014 [Saitozyma sp. JCM 24511]